VTEKFSSQRVLPSSVAAWRSREKSQFVTATSGSNTALPSMFNERSIDCRNPSAEGYYFLGPINHPWKGMLMTSRRRGFTLIELLVVISIIGVLVGLLLPAINSAREAGRRTQCQNNMRQLALGLQGFANQKNSFPAAGVFAEDPSQLDVNDASTSAILTWLPGGSGNPKGLPMYNWVVEVLPFIDNQEIFNQWSKTASAAPNAPALPRSYFDPTVYVTGNASNYKLSSTPISILRCPNDSTTLTDQGNLSYVANGGFSLWHVVSPRWQGSDIDNVSGIASPPLQWAPPATGWVGNMGVTTKLGVMYLESQAYDPSTGKAIKIPWNSKSTLTGIQDGASNTLLLGENTLAGASGGTPNYSKSIETNWASPLPSFCMFIASDNVCGQDGNCIGGQLAPTASQDDGPGWQEANRNGNLENINFGQNLSIEGSFPFANSAHPSGGNFAFCDGSVRFISSSIDGTVYAKIITPSGGKLPLICKQLPVNQDAFANQ
jgi:prepilin-type N-terminal cleavage/methylation domain-containing protein/prepilin-type processing-associated H-X9-DG protein